MKQTNSSIPAERQNKILNYLMSEYSISIKEATELCGVSSATVRRDLDEMSARGQIERTHGGAVLEISSGKEKVHSEKMKLMIAEKNRIAQEAVKLIHDGNSIFLDSGTTTLFLARQLYNFKDLTVITHNLDIAYQVKLHQTSTLLVTGGIRRDGYNVLVGEVAEEMVNRLSVDLVFMGADAINAKHGVYNSNFIEIGIKRAGIASGKHRILLSDHTKFQRRALTKVCDIDEFDVIITDEGLDEESKSVLKERNIKLILV